MVDNRSYKTINIRPIMAGCLLLPWLIMAICRGQQADEGKGYPFLKYYSSQEYKAHTQNFKAVQDMRGVLYIGNFAGILEYDGVNWRLIQTGKQTRVTALGIDQKGRIFVGAVGEMGFLAPDPNGVLTFNSITENLPANEQNFQEVMYCLPAPMGVYYITSGSICLWNGKTFTCWKTPGSVMSSFLVNNSLYFQVKGSGLYILQNNQIKAVPGGEVFTSAVEIQSMIPFQGNKVLIATDNQGLYFYYNDVFEPFPTEADAVLKEGKITCGILLPNEELAFGTLRKGLIIMSKSGEKVMILDQKAGLTNEYVTNLLIDKEQTLWVTLNDGLAHIDYPSPFGKFGQSNGLNGGVIDLARFQGKLYAATYQGLFKYSSSAASFTAIPGILTACWSVIPVDERLLVASSQGVYEVKNDRPVIIADGFSLRLFRSVKNPSKLFVGQTEGLLELTIDKNSIRNNGKIMGIHQEVREIAEDDQGRLWLSGPTGDILMISVDNTNNIKHYGEMEGLPGMTGKHLNTIRGQVFITSPKGLFLYDDKQNRFNRSNLLPVDTTSQQSWISRCIEDEKHNIWTQAGDEKQLSLYVKQPDQRYVRDYILFLPLADRVSWVIHPENNDITWFGGPEGALRYDRKVKKVTGTCPTPLIRRVLINNDSTAFFGAYADSSRHVSLMQPENSIPAFKPHENTLRFEFALPSFHVKGSTLYQYYLEGFDRIFSEWTTETQKEYTNLPKGKYVFRVKAKDIYGNVSGENVFAFRIKTPWYLSHVAYLFYALALGALLYLIVRWRSQQLLKEKKRLESLIMERTAEVVQQKEEMEQQSQELAYKNEELERINNVVKSINAQIEFSSLLQSILEKFMIIRGVEKATAVVYDKAREAYRYKASVGWDYRPFEQQLFSLNNLEEKYLQKAEEISEDIFLKTDFTSFPQEAIEGMTLPKAMLIMVIRLDNKVGGFLLLENSVKRDAFQSNDLSFISNLRQHIISAFIKTGILEDLQKTLSELKDTQDQLIQSEKLASLGQLTAGIAHEIQNPLNFVNNFAGLSIDLASEMKEHIEKVKESIDEDTRADMEDVTGMIATNVQKILEHGKRAENIVKGMLQHSRGRTGEFELVEINNMVAEYVNLAYHGMRAKDKSFNTAIKTELDPAVGKSYVVPQDLSRVILNIVNNSCYAVDQKAKTQGSAYRPEIIVSTKKIGKNIQITIHDNGTGIPQSVVDKIFNPFFTTKPTGKGTGLGLSMSFDIINQIHKGKLEVKTEEGSFTEFIITIPENLQK